MEVKRAPYTYCKSPLKSRKKVYDSLDEFLLLFFLLFLFISFRIHNLNFIENSICRNVV